jgi:hypothetical protein
MLTALTRSSIDKFQKVSPLKNEGASIASQTIGLAKPTLTQDVFQSSAMLNPSFLRAGNTASNLEADGEKLAEETVPPMLRAVEAVVKKECPTVYSPWCGGYTNSNRPFDPNGVREANKKSASQQPKTTPASRSPHVKQPK